MEYLKQINTDTVEIVTTDILNQVPRFWLWCAQQWMGLLFYFTNTGKFS